jgi:hypothetical protein
MVSKNFQKSAFVGALNKNNLTKKSISDQHFLLHLFRQQKCLTTAWHYAVGISDCGTLTHLKLIRIAEKMLRFNYKICFSVFLAISFEKACLVLKSVELPIQGQTIFS